MVLLPEGPSRPEADGPVRDADCDDMASTEACIKGLEKSAEERIEKKQLKAIYLHTSGTGEYIDPDTEMGTLDPTVYDVRKVYHPSYPISGTD